MFYMTKLMTIVG